MVDITTSRPGLSVVPNPEVERIVDADIFRSVFRCHEAGVVVITADEGNARATCELFRTDYTGATLRDHYGLARPAGRTRALQEAVS